MIGGARLAADQTRRLTIVMIATYRFRSYFRRVVSGGQHRSRVMGFGYGGSQARAGIRRYANSMVAHVWNAQTEERGQSGNGNFYFERRTLYSYGSHFPVGFIAPDGVAILNADSYSVSTSGHQSDARGAVRNRRTVSIPKLGDALNGGLNTLAMLADTAERVGVTARERRESMARVRKGFRAYIMAHAEALADSWVREPGETGWRWNEETGRSDYAPGIETAGAYLTRLAGLPAASWPKLQRDAAAAKTRREKADKLAAEKRAKAGAIAAADATDSTFRAYVRRLASNYAPEASFAEAAKEWLRHKKAAKRFGLSARRMESIRQRERRLRDMREDAERIGARVKARESLRRDIETVRNAAKAIPAISGRPDYQDARRIGDAATALGRLAERPLFPFATRRRLKLAADRAAAVVEALAADRAADQARERAVREMETAAFRAAWLAGTVPLAGRRFDADTGGAALRIIGDTLETSHGAEVPLGHAVRAFRFVKLCRERGEGWQSNGRTIRVGHFQVDRIEPSGDMVAGCHSFTWAEIERAARAAGVFDCPADDSAVIVRESAHV